LREGRAGEDSLEGIGEFAAEVVCLGWRRLGAGREVVEASRESCAVVVVAGGAGVDVVDVVDAAGAIGVDAGIGSAVSRVALGAAAEGLSSILGAKGFTSREMFEEEGSGR
jgi:hypothetical protein